MKRMLAVLATTALIVALSLPLAATAGAASWTGYVSTDALNVRTAPNTSAEIVDTLYFGDAVALVGTVTGEDAGLGSLWYETISGWYVYGAYVSDQPVSAPIDTTGGFGGRWIDVDVSNQTATAYEGNTPVYTAAVTTGRPGNETPLGTYYIFSRVYDETMVSTTPGDEYYLEN